MSISKFLMAAGATVLICVAILIGYLLKDPRPAFAQRRSAIATITESSSDTVGGSTIQKVSLTATSGLSVDFTLRRELGDGARRLPAVLILGGHLTGAEAATVVGATPGVMVAAMSYPFKGDLRPSTLTFVRQIPKIRAAFHDTPPALLLVLDYLYGRKDVDTTRVEAVGVSLGAPFVTIAAAMDQRFYRVWSLHGSGGSYAPLEASMQRTIAFGPLRAIAAGMANLIISGPRLAPERWVADVAPRPFIMVNALDDELLPRSSVEALFAGALEPKELIWMSGQHIHGDRETIQRLVAIVMARVAAPAAP